MQESTRGLILLASKKLFNERGVYNVSLRQVAAELGISQGNLSYHFKKKEDIIKELYYEFTEALNNEFSATTKLGPNFYFVIELARKTFEAQFEYKFFLTDLHYIVNDIPELATKVSELSKQRINQFNELFKVFVEKGYMRNAEYADEYEELGSRLYILGVYSMLPVLAEFDGQKTKSLKKYLTIILSACYPYLSKEGKKRYATAVADYIVE